MCTILYTNATAKFKSKENKYTLGNSEWAIERVPHFRYLLGNIYLVISFVISRRHTCSIFKYYYM